MFYLKATEEAALFETIVMENVFGEETPYFASIDLKPETMLSLPHAVIHPQANGQSLAWNTETATWCIIHAPEHLLCQELLLPKTYRQFRLTAEAISSNSSRALPVFLTHLYRQGLLALDGRLGINPAIYAGGPLFGEVFTLELMLTESCNLRCSYCFAEAEADKPAMDVETGKLAIEKMLSLPDRKFIVKFGGGEPLTKFHVLKQLMDFALTANQNRPEPAAILFDITTNGTLINHQVIKALKHYPIRLCVSFDGLPQTHDSERRFPNGLGSHRRVLRSFERLSQAQIPFRVITVVRKPHLAIAEETFAHYEELGIRHTRFNPMIRSGRGLGLDHEQGISPLEYFEFMKRLVHYIGEKRTLEEDNIQSMLRNLVFRTRDFRCMRSPCGAGQTFMNVDPQGRIHPCAFYRASTRTIDLGSVKSPGLSFQNCADQDPTVRAMSRRTVRSIPHCSKCTWRQVCTGGCSLSALTEHGSLGQPTALCEYYQRIYPFLLEYFSRNPGAATFLLPNSEPVAYSAFRRDQHSSNFLKQKKSNLDVQGSMDVRKHHERR